MMQLLAKMEKSLKTTIPCQNLDLQFNFQMNLMALMSKV